MLFIAFIYAFALASIIFVLTPYPTDFTLSFEIFTVTSPRASLPPVAAFMEYSSSFTFIPIALSIALKVASRGPSPQAASSFIQSLQLILTVEVDVIPLPLDIWKYSSLYVSEALFDSCVTSASISLSIIYFFLSAKSLNS